MSVVTSGRAHTAVCCGIIFMVTIQLVLLRALVLHDKINVYVKMLAQEKKRDNRNFIAANMENTQLLNYLQCIVVLSPLLRANLQKEEKNSNR